ncbi:MAG TPA: hypothetical protein PLL98_03885 [Bacillota bacterium]|nr:hypothetical protein [Bacillota bacterium]HOR85608.1 hypothetical protein [Bacillota bacterium]HPL53670.1 hypothetical protein [Bacillota bacterium]
MPDYDYYNEPSMGSRQKKFTREEALKIGKAIGIDFNKIDLEQFRKGLEVELEHGTRFPQANVTGDNPILTGKIAYAHLLEFPDYYTRLAKLEKEAKAYWGIL